MHHLLFAMCTLLMAPPNDGPVTWSFHAERTDGGLALVATAHIAEGWYMYATQLPSEDGPPATALLLCASHAQATPGPVLEPEPMERYDPNFAMMLRYHKGEVPFRFMVRPNGTDAFVLAGEVEFMCCTDLTCLPPRTVPFKVEVPAIPR